MLRSVVAVVELARFSGFLLSEVLVISSRAVIVAQVCHSLERDQMLICTNHAVVKSESLMA